MLQIFQYEFIKNALFAGSIIGILAPLVGNFLIVKRQAALSDTISHVSLFGVAIGLFLGFNPSITAIIISILVSVFLVCYRGFVGVYKEAFLTMLTALSLAFVAILGKINGGFKSSLYSYLFGSINTITTENILLLIIIAIFSLFCILFWYKKFLIVCLDKNFAKIKGVNIWIYELLLMIIISMILSIGIQIFGAMTVTAFVIIPVVSAWNISDSFFRCILWSIIISIFAIWSSIFVSFYAFDLPSSSVSVIILCIIFAITSAKKTNA